MDHKQILIIDNDGGVRASIRLSLQITTEWKILTAASEKEALILALTKQPDAILLDITICDCNRNEILRHLQTNRATQKIPIIFLTAKELAKEQEKQKNVKGVIFKPFDAIGLYEQICLLLNWER